MSKGRFSTLSSSLTLKLSGHVQSPPEMFPGPLGWVMRCLLVLWGSQCTSRVFTVCSGRANESPPKDSHVGAARLKNPASLKVFVPIQDMGHSRTPV